MLKYEEYVSVKHCHCHLDPVLTLATLVDSVLQLCLTFITQVQYVRSIEHQNLFATGSPLNVVASTTYNFNARGDIVNPPIGDACTVQALA